jgi:hypothetical protein
MRLDPKTIVQISPGHARLPGMLAGVVEDQGEKVIVMLVNDPSENRHELLRASVRVVGYLPSWQPRVITAGGGLGPKAGGVDRLRGSGEASS